MSDLTRADVQRLIAQRLDELGLARIGRLFSVEHNVPRGTHKVGTGTLAAGDMLKAVYDTDDDGIVDQAENADTLDHKHASDFLEGTYDAEYKCLMVVK